MNFVHRSSNNSRFDHHRQGGGGVKSGVMDAPDPRYDWSGKKRRFDDLKEEGSSSRTTEPPAPLNRPLDERSKRHCLGEFDESISNISPVPYFQLIYAPDDTVPIVFLSFSCLPMCVLVGSLFALGGTGYIPVF